MNQYIHDGHYNWDALERETWDKYGLFVFRRFKTDFLTFYRVSGKHPGYLSLRIRLPIFFTLHQALNFPEYWLSITGSQLLDWYTNKPKLYKDFMKYIKKQFD